MKQNKDKYNNIVARSTLWFSYSAERPEDNNAVKFEFHEEIGQQPYMIISISNGTDPEQIRTNTCLNSSEAAALVNFIHHSMRIFYKGTD